MGGHGGEHRGRRRHAHALHAPDRLRVRGDEPGRLRGRQPLVHPQTLSPCNPSYFSDISLRNLTVSFRLLLFSTRRYARKVKASFVCLPAMHLAAEPITLGSACRYPYCFPSPLNTIFLGCLNPSSEPCRCEWAADYHTEEPHKLDYGLLPTEQQQLHFVRAYVAAILALQQHKSLKVR